MTERREPNVPPHIYESAFRGTDVPMIVTDTAFVVRDANDACVEFTGYDRSELVGGTANRLFDDTDVYGRMAEALARGETWTGGFEARTKAGRLVYGRGSCVPIVVDGECRGYAGVFTDLTERRQYERSLRVLNRVLRHNLRNDANVILGRIDLVAEELDDEELLESLATARRKVRNALDYAERARELDELLCERTDPDLRPIRLDETVRRELSNAGDRHPDAEFRDGLGSEPVVVAGDDALGTALEAVLSNAVEHNDGETPHVVVRLDAGDSHVTLTVGDDGPGVPESDRDRIFGREELGPLHHGEGLDLFFVDRLMEKYGGDVWVEDGDEGAAFKLRFQAMGAEATDSTGREVSEP